MPLVDVQWKMPYQLHKSRDARHSNNNSSTCDADTANNNDIESPSMGQGTARTADEMKQAQQYQLEVQLTRLGTPAGGGSTRIYAPRFPKV
jgi:hypothetical protein